MDYSTLPKSSGSGLPSGNVPPFPFGFQQSTPLPAVEPRARLEALRLDLAAGARSIDSILRAATDAARVLSGADGTALALRTDGAIVCRARSGDMAPELGAVLNVSSGFSGECFCSASILLCDDTATDRRVDSEVCRTLGVRSIVAVPLRGSVGIAGILEAFSTRAHAFGAEQIDSLRGLAEIAEAAYEREQRTQSPIPALPKPGNSRPEAGSNLSATRFATADAATLEIANPIPRGKFFEGRFLKTSWIFGAAALAVLLVSMVLWLSWREPAGQAVASEAPAATPTAIEKTFDDPVRVAVVKPEAGIVGRPSERTRTKDVLQKAAEIQPATDGRRSSTPVSDITPPKAPENATVNSAAPSSASVPPPSVEVATPAAPQELATLSAGSALLPAFGATVSQGIIEGNLVRKVDPVYPPQARTQKVTGWVTLDATIAKDGSVHEVKVINGPSLLADAATAAVRQWRYSPSTLNGTPIEVQKQITIAFKLP